jgi:hypothetical protein
MYQLSTNACFSILHMILVSLAVPEAVEILDHAKREAMSLV